MFILSNYSNLQLEVRKAIIEIDSEETSPEKEEIVPEAGSHAPETSTGGERRKRAVSGGGGVGNQGKLRVKGEGE